jgi:peroxidase
MNQASAFLDGSTVYGYGAGRARELRTGRGGRLRMRRARGRDLLPPAEDPADPCNTPAMAQQGRYCFVTGYNSRSLHLSRDFSTLSTILIIQLSLV